MSLTVTNLAGRNRHVRSQQALFALGERGQNRTPVESTAGARAPGPTSDAWSATR